MAPQRCIEAGERRRTCAAAAAPGFPPGKKWSFVPHGRDAPRPKYLVCNADEMEPGTFKDRLLLEGDPHQLIEGMIVTAYAIQADVGYIFLRGEYVLAAERLARHRGSTRRGIIWAIIFSARTSASSCTCTPAPAGTSVEKKPPCSMRWKASAPYPRQAALSAGRRPLGQTHDRQNVETLCNVPHIVNHGAAWFRGLSRANDGGTKLYGVSGKVKRPGLWELPMGTTIREILEEHAGGMRDGVRFRGLLPGGASTDFLIEEHLDLPWTSTRCRRSVAVWAPAR